jgi:uncharacterized DUF497 family protein
MRFHWDAWNSSHIAAHGVIPSEAEQAVRDRYRVALPGRQVRGEERGVLLGAADRGEAEVVLFVVYTVRAGRLRVVTTYEARPTHRRRYFAHRTARTESEEATNDEV